MAISLSCAVLPAFGVEAAAEITLMPGLNLVSPPGEAPAGFTCADLQTALGAVAVQHLNAQAQVFETCEPPGTTFPIVAGEGYVVWMDAEGTASLTGEPNCPVVNLAAGLNLLGVSSPLPGLSCFTLLQAIGDRDVVAAIQRFDPITGAYMACAYSQDQAEVGPVGVDFPLQPGEAYLVSMRTERLGLAFREATLCNSQPVAEAGPHQEVTVGTTAQLDGSGSSDADNDPLTFAWSIIGQPAGSTATLVDDTTAQPQLTPDVAGDYLVQLMVNDGERDSAPDSVLIRATLPNLPPVADAGADRNVFTGNVVMLDGSGSSDPNDDPLTFAWQFTTRPAGSTATLTAADTATPSFTPDLDGMYRIELLVGDGEFTSDPDEVVITATTFVDSDNDGSADSDDCAPNDPDIFPGAVDVCSDGIDNDCSGVADDKDFDRDGFVDIACNGDDVADDDATINPNESEICNDGKDNDSNTLIDSADPVCAPGCDLDGDQRPGDQCGGTDADDFDPSVFAGAPELCGDVIDNNQNGQIDEGCNPGGISFGPSGIRLAAGDAVTLRVLDEQQSTPTNWQFSIAAGTGGTVTLGTVTPAADDPSVATYLAPATDQRLDLTITATDPNDNTRSAQATVSVFPLVGVFEVLPAGPIVGLDNSVLFRAQLNIAGVGTIPLRRVVWKINNVIGGFRDVGGITPSGLYDAPIVMPAPLPFDITVGFSLTAAGPVLGSTDILLAELTADPPLIRAINAGNAGQVSGSLRTSDNQVANVPQADLAFSTRAPRVATVDNTGTVTVLDRVGRAFIQAVHRLSGAFDGTMVEARSDVSLRLEIARRTRDFARIERTDAAGVSDIEYTTPGAAFNVQPVLTVLRGQNAGEEFSSLGENITITADGTNVVAYDAADGEPDRANLVATVERRTGFVRLGRRPGSGTITVTYDDGVVRHSAPLTVIFTRPQLEVTHFGSESFSNDEVFQTEFIVITITASNPTGSGFLGDIPLQITTPATTPFQVAKGIDPATGRASLFLRNQLVETRTVNLTIPGTVFVDPFSPPSTVSFMIVPPGDGEQTLLIDLREDRGAEVVEHKIPVKRPPLAFQGCQTSAFGANSRGVAPGHLVVNSWLQVFHGGVGLPARTSVHDLVFAPNVFGFAQDDKPVWEITMPDGSNVSIDSPELGIVPLNASQEGEYIVEQTLAMRPQVRSAPLQVEVVQAATVAGVGVEEVLDDGNPVPRDQMFGAFKILDAVDGRWVDDEPFAFRVQLLNANGQPGPIGKEIRQRILDSSGEFVREQSGGFELVNLQVDRVLGPFISVQISNSNVPDQDGIFTITVTPSATPLLIQDLLVRLRPQIQPKSASLVPAEVANQLPDEVQEIRDGNATVITPAPIGVAAFSDPLDQVYTRQCLHKPGYGAVAVPRELPIATPRLRDAVAAGKAPAGADKLTFLLRGGQIFADSAATGLVQLDLGAGLTVEQTEVVPEGLRVTASSDPTAFVPNQFGFNPNLGERSIAVSFADNTRWLATVRMVTGFLHTDPAHKTKDLPLNARHDGHPVGTQVFFLGIEPDRFSGQITRAELLLMPSVQTGDTILGVQADQPLVTFDRQRDPDTGRIGGSATQRTLLATSNTVFTVYGNIKDDFRFDPDSRLLVPGQDKLPDFASREKDAETLVASIQGNWFDLLSFTAFKLIAEPDDGQTGPAQPLDFDLSLPIDTNYSRVSLPNGDTNGLAVGNDALTRNRVAVHVDHHAAGFDLNTDTNLLDAAVPFSYFGGMLDQAFLFRRTPLPNSQMVPLGKDGRVGAFDGERGENQLDATQRQRRGFGVELDGALYDPSFSALDAAPNSPALIQLPVVTNIVNGLTDKNLLPDQGGTSGGYYDLDLDFPGSHFLVAKTPGAEFPGLHTGYLLQDRPEDQLNANTGLPEDDLKDIRLTRKVKPGELAVGSPLDEPRDSFGVVQRKRAMTWSTAHDKTGPIRTALRMTTLYRITTDPPGLDDLQFEAALWVRERPLAPEDSLSMLVKTQSMGNEKRLEVVLKTASDLVIDLAADALLTALTGGAYADVCGASRGAIVAANLVNAGVGLLEDDAFTEVLAFDEETIQAAQTLNGLLRDGQDAADLGDDSPLPKGSGIKVNVSGVIEDFFEQGVEKLKKGTPISISQSANVGQVFNICIVADAPKEKLKDTIKAAFDAEDLGGNGAAAARVTKMVTVAIPNSARRDDGSPIIQFGLQRRIDIQPRERSAVLFEERPEFARYNTDAASQSDLELLKAVIADLDDPARAEVASTFLKRVAVNSIVRNPGVLAGVFSGYRPYRLRAISLPEIEGVIVPKADLGNGSLFADFELTTNTTVIPLTAASVATVQRTNENAGARAAVTSQGYDLIVLKAVIREKQE